MNDRIYLNAKLTNNKNVELRAFVVPTLGAEFGIEQNTPTGWLLVREYFLADLVDDRVDDLMLDLGTGWVIRGLRAATDEAQTIVDAKREAENMPWYVLTLSIDGNYETAVLQAPKLSFAEGLALDMARDAAQEANGLTVEEAEQLSIWVVSYVRTQNEPENVGAY